FSALSAPAVGVLALARRGRWGDATLLGGTTAALCVGGVVAIQGLSGGRFLENFAALGSGGMTAENLRLGPARFLLAASHDWRGLFLLALAAMAVALRGLDKSFGLWEGYAILVALSLVVIFMSPGTDPNHLVELEAAAVIVLARFTALPDGR